MTPASAQQWVIDHRLPIKQDADDARLFYDQADRAYFLITGDDERLFDEEFYPVLSDEDAIGLNAYNPDFYIFQFGTDFYFSSTYEDKLRLTPFRHLGRCERTIEEPFPHLAVHGEYELLNGSRQYSDWCKKAKFLGVQTLAICERNTLGGTLPFQVACADAKIKAILGEQVVVKAEDEQYEVKVYATNQAGWQSMLRLNKILNVDRNGFVLEQELLAHSEGLALVLTASVPLNAKRIAALKSSFALCYYQFDAVEYLSDDHDLKHLEKLREYLFTWFEQLPPILIHDSYYLDKQDAHIKVALNKIGKGSSHQQSADQYFKCIEELFEQLDGLFGEDFVIKSMDFLTLFNGMWHNANHLAATCDFNIKLGQLHLPSYEAIGQEVDHSMRAHAQNAWKNEYGVQAHDNIGLFYELIERGFVQLVENKHLDADLYVSRLETECAVIEKGGFVDYFLILWDILNFCKEADILVGAGRGSAAGSLVAYLLGITQIDPIHYNLLFERFLNESRITKGLPDIDLDFQSERKDEVKAYMLRKYGADHVTRIGTYSTLKVRGALKDFARAEGLDVATVNYVTGAFDTEGEDWQELFEAAVRIPVVKHFIHQHPNLVNDIRLCMNQPKTTSQHAAGMIITPKTDQAGNAMTVFDWMPVRMVDGVLISEWEGQWIEAAGFLKEDILSLSQLDKFSLMLKIIKERTGEDIILNDIPLDDPNIYNLFSQGFNEDVFQFGGAGLKNFCQDVEPTTIDQLIAVVALYRPGPMEVGAHRDYIKLNRGEIEPKYDYLLEEVTAPTRGLYIYQEQIMQAFTVLGGFTLVEADGVRKAMGKKIKEQMDGYRQKFLDGAQGKGCDEFEAIAIWNTLEVFSGYGFNKSHAAAYTTMGYWSQWLKFHHPVAFWTASLQFSKDEKIPSRIAEINRLPDSIAIAPPDINYSQEAFTPDPKRNKIYWSIGRIKGLGEVAVQTIIAERAAHGPFLTFEDFCNRVPKRQVNRAKIIALILAGAFDQIERITAVQGRMQVLWRYMLALKDKVDPTAFPAHQVGYEHFWVIKQKQLTGFGYLKYVDILSTTPWHKLGLKVVDGVALANPKLVDKVVLAGGIIIECMVRKSKRGEFARVLIDCNDEVIECTVWNEQWLELQEQLQSLVGRPVFIKAKVVHDGKYAKKNVLHAFDETELYAI